MRINIFFQMASYRFLWAIGLTYGFLLQPALALDHNHSLWNTQLNKYVNTRGRVHYPGFQKNPSFQMYLQQLSSVSHSQYNGFSRNQKLSFLINAYNAFTIKLVADHYPVQSIKKIRKLTAFAFTPWKIKFFTLLGKQRNLDWIEHRMLRKKFKEPRIHFAIVCASIGCPPLANRAYTAATLDSQLSFNMKRFLTNRSRNRYDKNRNLIKISPIFKWFREDFGSSDEAIIRFINTTRKQKIPANARIEYTYYNWNLNKQ